MERGLNMKSKQKKLIKNLLSLSLAVVMVLGMMPGIPASITVQAAEAVTYLDASGVAQTCTEYTVIENTSTTWESGWYVTDKDVTINDRITVKGEVHLILLDGITLTAAKGITVPSDGTFHVYAQSDNEQSMGVLNATATEWGQAGIGGDGTADAGDITINGGRIIAKGNVGAGLGSGRGYKTFGIITINGGVIEAEDSSGCGCGIGNGNYSYANIINLYGGVINAKGIGLSNYSDSCEVTINISNRIKKIVSTPPEEGGACIGKSDSILGTVNTIFWKDGTQLEGEAITEEFVDSGEGSVRIIRAKRMNHKISISDALKAGVMPDTEYALSGEAVTLTINEDVITTLPKVFCGDSELTLTKKENGKYTFIMSEGDVTLLPNSDVKPTYSVSLPESMEIVSATTAADNNGKYIAGTVVTLKEVFPYIASEVTANGTILTAQDGTYSATVEDKDIVIKATAKRGENNKIDLSGATGDFKALDGDILTDKTSYTVNIVDGAGVTLSDVTINGGIICEGTATIVLEGTNAVTGASNRAGIQIGGERTTLTIKGEGSLTAQGDYFSAGIGLSSDEMQTSNGGNIVIEGGTIVATGDNSGAGIGTGVAFASSKRVIGDITIKGGNVKATGGEDASGIGAGGAYSGRTIEVGDISICCGIDRVDVSSISQEVIYKHGDENVTDNREEHFDVMHNGYDGRINIMSRHSEKPCYAITVEPVEHGSIGINKIAYEGEEITIYDIPDIGYRFAKLTVTDAEGNEIVTDARSFIMPASDVTVNVEFTSFSEEETKQYEWINDDDSTDRVKLYDGITTINIKNAGSYYIKTDNGNIKIDSYNGKIPYAGGVGNISSYSSTGFRFNEMDTGWYDIMVSDIGSGRYYVAVRGTVPTIDEIPEQVYTGNEIKPVPVVRAGSLSLTSGTDYTYEYSANKNAGEATVTVRFKGDYSAWKRVTRTFTIRQATPEYTVPTNITAVCGTKLSEVVLPEGFKWTDEDVALTGDSVTKKAKFIPNDTQNYEEVTDIDIKIGITDHIFTNYVPDGDATCLIDGHGTAKCDHEGCNITDNKLLEGSALGHSYKETFSWAEDGSACTIIFTCDRAGCTSDTKDHTITYPCVVTEGDKTPATCVAMGTTTYIATYKTESKTYTDTKAVENIAINPDNHINTTIVNQKDATCTETGWGGDTCCSGCKKILTQGKLIPALGHDYAPEFTVDKAATCAAVGSRSRHCTRCDEKIEITELPKTEHTWDNGKVTTEPTETAEGVKTYSCSTCGQTKTETIPKKEMVTTQPLKDTTTTQPSKNGDVITDDKTNARYEVNDVAKKEVIYNGLVDGDVKNIIIPDTVTINGEIYKVTKIADNAFKGNKMVTTITVGSNIKTIGKNAFSGCKRLKTLIIQSKKLTAKTVSKKAFKEIAKGVTVKVPKKKISAYKKLFKKKGLSSKNKVKGY